MQINKFSVWLSTNKCSEMMTFPSIFIEMFFLIRMTSKDDIFSWSLISLMYLLNVIYIICMTSTQVQTNWLARVWRIMRNNQTCKCLFATIPKIWGVTRQPVMTICCICSTVFPPGSYEGVHRPINAFEHPHYLCFMWN